MNWPYFDNLFKLFDQMFESLNMSFKLARQRIILNSKFI
jgi:hypothetical protein